MNIESQHISAVLFLLLTAFSSSVAVSDQQPTVASVPPTPWSFENGLPDGIIAEGSTVSISEADCQGGKYALRWQYKPGGSLTLPTGPLGNINVRSGYGGYNRSAIEFRIRTIEAPGALTCRFMSGDQSGGEIRIPLVFDGWQRICYHLSWKSKLDHRNEKALTNTDRFVIEAPDKGSGGTVYLDLVSFNTPIDFRKERVPIIELWQAVDLHAQPELPNLTAAPIQDELDALTYFRQKDPTLYPGQPANVKGVESLEATARSTFGLHRLPGGKVAGQGLDEWRPLTAHMRQVAIAWLHTQDPALKDRLETLFFLENDFLRQQGGVAQGAIQGINWYNGREHGDACYIMRTPLQRTGRLKTVLDCLKFNWDYKTIFETGFADTQSMDYFFLNVHYLFKIALMHNDPEDCVLHLRAFSQRFSQQLVDTIKPDGSLYHHGFHYFAYGGYSSEEMAQQVNIMAPTVFQVTPEAYTKLKLALMNMRWYANVRDVPLTLHGRHPGRQQLYPDSFAMLAEAGRPYRDGALDPELATATLRLNPDLAGSSPFIEQSFQPEPAPTGHVTMPFAGLGSHRRDEWMALVRGYSKYLKAQESYGNANRHGLFFGNGYLDILGGGDPVTITDSGCRPNEGWDWRRLDGTTSIDIPYAQMANGNRTMSELSEEVFVGGLTHDGRNGLFAMPLNSTFQYQKALPKGMKPASDGAFRANKSTFFFDDRIVCLGSDIALPDSPYPVITTLFQKFLKPIGNDVPGGYDSIQVNGKTITTLPYTKTLARETDHQLIDPQNTGYYIPSGQDLRVVRRHQRSRDGHDKKDTEGDYASAWLDHGMQPKNGGYEYALLVQTTPAQLAQFTADMTGGKSPPYTVCKKDKHAHVVRDADSATWGAVFFTAQETPQWRASSEASFSVKAVDRPCLIMQEDLDADHIQLSVADPDLNLGGEYNQSQPQTLTLLLHGRYTSPSIPPNVELKSNHKGGSVLIVECINGESVTLTLRRWQRPVLNPQLK